MIPVKLLGQHVKAAVHLAASEQGFGEYLVIPKGLYDHCPGSTSAFQVLVMNEGEQPLLQDAGLPVVGEMVKPDLLTVPTLPPPTLQAMEEPPKPHDMQQLWEDLELSRNDFLQKDLLLKKEVWKLIFEYKDIFSNTTQGCTDIVELQLRLK